MQQLSDELERAIERVVARLDREDDRRLAIARREQEFLGRTLLLVEELLDEGLPADPEGLRRELRGRFERTSGALTPQPFPSDVVDALRVLVVDIRHGNIRD